MNAFIIHILTYYEKVTKNFHISQNSSLSNIHTKYIKNQIYFNFHVESKFEVPI